MSLNSNIVSFDTRERAYAGAIDNAESFSELFAVITQYGPIEGSTQEYSAGELITRVAVIKSLAASGYPAAPDDFARITRSLGLRHKCKELYSKRLQSVQDEY